MSIVVCNSIRARGILRVVRQVKQLPGLTSSASSSRRRRIREHCGVSRLERYGLGSLHDDEDNGTAVVYTLLKRSPGKVRSYLQPITK